MRYFNTEGQCEPDERYMVRLDDRLEKIKKLFVDRGKYFVINRGRQYGKTTTLRALANYLKADYVVVSLDFQGMSTADFETERRFVVFFTTIFINAIKMQLDKDKHQTLREISELASGEQFDMKELFLQLSKVCEVSEKPVVMMIDEVDSASNNQVFIDFLAQLRQYYLARREKPAFYSVILAGVYDIKNLKLKIRPDEGHQYNSPWNTRESNESSERLHTFDDCSRDQIAHVQFDIAAKFNIDMSFSAEQIAEMLKEYEADYQTGMNITDVSDEIYQYTSGYPYLVSAICKRLDEELTDAWTKEGVTEAVKMMLNEKAPLFDSMVRHINEYPELKKMLYAMLFLGEQVTYNPDNKIIDLACMFGYTVNAHGSVRVANRIFETRLYNLFLSEEELESLISRKAKQDKSQFVSNGRLNMDLALEKFVEYFTDIYGKNDEKFVENYGRKFFLLYLKPIINGTGNYYIEAQTRNERRTDVIVDYLGEQFIVELKIWYGNEYNTRGERQLMDYLDYFRQKKGYMLSFNFNKNKETGMKTITVGDKTIVEAVV